MNLTDTQRNLLKLAARSQHVVVATGMANQGIADAAKLSSHGLLEDLGEHSEKWLLRITPEGMRALEQISGSDVAPAMRTFRLRCLSGTSATVWIIEVVARDFQDAWIKCTEAGYMPLGSD